MPWQSRSCVRHRYFVAQCLQRKPDRLFAGVLPFFLHFLIARIIYRAIKPENRAGIKQNHATICAIAQEYSESRKNSCAIAANDCANQLQYRNGMLYFLPK